MIGKLKRSLIRRVWPQGDLNLLLGAAFLPDAEALRYWREWKRQRNIEDVSWEEHKLLARIAGRLARIDPDCPYRPRLEGLSRAHWTQSQLMLRASADALDSLIGSGIPAMLLKGGALHAAGLTKGPRITSDLDILVRRSDFPRAMEALYAAGWTTKYSVEFMRISWRFSHGANLRRRPHGDIDVHHQPVHGAMVADEALEAMWARAVRADFHGRPVLIPSLEDMIVFASDHAVHSCADKEPTATWVFDLALLAGQPGVDTDKVAEIARSFGSGVDTLATVSYLESLAGNPVTARMAATLAGRISGVRPWLDFAFKSLRRPHGRLLRRLARRVSGTQGFEYVSKVVPRLRPAWRTFQAAHEIPVARPNGEERLRHDMEIPLSAAMPKRLVLEIAFEPGTRRLYQFDISAEGMPIGRLFARADAGKSSTKNVCVAIPIRGGGFRQLSIQSLARTSLALNVPAAELEKTKPVPFRVVRLSWD
jgi:hypothetical protein